MKIKTRFAPSPTGYLHIGSVRTALYSWLFARKFNGKFVLRIENTDFQRSTQLAIKAIIDSMNWLNINWDEGPYLQTERFERYNELINDMLVRGKAYKCYCSKERLKILRAEQISKGKKPRYDGHCLDNNKQDFNNLPHVVRFCNPQNGSVIFNDLIRGPIEFSNHELDDLIIRRADGSPTYNFCVVVDDFDMDITHVIRGEEHINNTPRQINILKALGAPIPYYAHVSMILGNDGKKLSKRHGSMGIMQYRDAGFLPEAILNYLLCLGWSYGNREIFSINEMKKYFMFDKVSKSSSTFSMQKLLWLNHYYINHLPANYIASHLAWHIQQLKINDHTGPELDVIVKLLGNRHKTLKDIAINCRYFYEDFNEFDIDAAKKYLQPVVIPVLKTLYYKLTSISEWTPFMIRATLQEIAKKMQISMDKIGMPLRVAVTGVTQSPAIDMTMHVIGQKRCLTRIEKALTFIKCTL